MKTCARAIVCIFCLLLAGIGTHRAQAQTTDAVDGVSSAIDPFYDGRDLRIDNFEGVELEPCRDEISAGTGGLCYIIAGHGAILVTVNDGYDLATRLALERHLIQSRDALAGMKNVEVVGAEIVEDSPNSALMARFEVLRCDRGIADRFGISSPVRQISYLYPYRSQLVQVFVYVGLDDASPDVLEHIENTLKSAHFKSPQNGCSSDDGQCSPLEDDTATEPRGAMALMPRALLYGGAIALTIILILNIRGRIRRRQEGKSRD